MLVRQDFSFVQEMPPKPFMMQIMDVVGKAYCFLWEKKNKNYQVKLSWKELDRYCDKKSFRSSLRKLNNEGLLSYAENDNGIHVELVGYDEVINDM